MNQFPNMYSQNYIQQYIDQQYQYQQKNKIIETTHKFYDLLNSIDQIDPNYRNELIAYCSVVLIDYARKHNNI